MKTVEESRVKFEANFLILGEIKLQKLTFNRKLNCYTDLMGKYVDRANWVNGAWFMFQELGK